MSERSAGIIESSTLYFLDVLLYPVGMYTKGYFKGKKITVMGLGLLGRGVGDAEFLAAEGADLIVTDLKTKEQLADSVKRLEKFPNITFRLGGHNLSDFKDRDFILKAAGVPLDSKYIEEAKKHNVPIEMGASLFCSLIPSKNTIGITGTRGKSTVTQFIFETLEHMGKTVYLGGNVRGVSTLAMLPDIEEDDYIVMELDSWQLQGFGDRKISPHVAVFTSIFKDHMNYYKDNMDAYIADKANIFLNQKPDDIFVIGEQVESEIQKRYPEHFERASSIGISGNVSTWKLKLVGAHNLYNASIAFDTLRLLGLKTEDIKEAFEEMNPVEGRLEFVREVERVRIYNDNNATTPDATIAGLKALGSEKPVILIMGGADKGLDMRDLAEVLPGTTRKVIFTPGNGTDNFIATYDLTKNGVSFFRAENIEDAVKEAMAIARNGDTILFSPAFSSFSQFNNEYERSDELKRVIDTL